LILSAIAALLLIEAKATGVMMLPPGETHLARPIEVPSGSKHLTIRGDSKGSVLVLDTGFRGSAAIVADGALDLKLEGFEIRGNRLELKSDWYLPLNEAAFADFYSDNGIVVRHGNGLVVRGVRFSRIRAFPLLVNASSNVTIDSVVIEDCGTLNRAGRNNTTGGILLEEGVSHFEIRRAFIRRITGNAIWTHSYARSPRASDGVIAGNVINTVGRDAVQVGHATRVRVEDNSGAEIGFPAEYVDVESHGVGVALDTAGNVDRSIYTGNYFDDVNGQCIDLDGFHDGEVTRNSCINHRSLDALPALHFGVVFGNNDPGMKSSGVVVRNNILQGFAYGGVFLIGSGNRIENNQFLDLNRAHCGTTPVSARCNYALDQPDLLRSGIYLGNNGGRPTVTKDNVIYGNTFQGFGIAAHCISAAPGVALPPNENKCSEAVTIP
jgi:hypothetical protein